MLAVAGTLAFVGIRWSNTADTQREVFSSEPVQRVPAAPKAAALTGADRDYVRQIAALFIDTAVLRRHIDDSWELTTPKLRQGLSRREWDTGNIPVTPFPAEAVDQIKYTLDWSGEDLVYLKVAIIPKATSPIPGQAFSIGLERQDVTAKHAWLVDYWVPSGLGQRTSAQRARDPAPAPVERASASIPQAWILAPLGLVLLLVVGLPLVIFGRQRWSSSRALRAYHRERS